VQDILDFSALRKSSYALKSEPVYLRKVIEIAFNTARPMAEKNGLDYRLSIDENVPTLVEGDGVRLQQILLNLLGNAVKFTPSGSVTLDVKQESINTSINPPVAILELRVGDTGIGIRREDKLRMFEPFTQLGLSQHVPREGAGLGLAIVKRLCELMGGSIELDSEPGSGSRFRMVLPVMVLVDELEKAGADGRVPTMAEPEPALNLAAMVPLKILVAEDNPFIRNLLIEYLKQLGYTPLAVATGGEAVRNWRGHDLLILDLRMPEMDGVEASNRIREECGDREKPWIIGVSATLQEPEIERAMAAGMNDFLGKPFFVSGLQEAIQASPIFASQVKADGFSRDEVAAVSDDEPEDEVDPPPNGGSSWAPPGDTADIYRVGGLDSALIQQAIDEIPGLIGEMKQGLVDRDFDLVQDRAHYLKNTIYALRMDELFEPCREVYDQAGLGRVGDGQRALDTLKAVFSQWQESHRKIS